jgi:hypothetical protein
MSDALTPAAPPLADARERAIRVLTDRYADDTLSTAEFETRLDRLYGTQTPAAVDALVADLVAPRAVAAPTGPMWVPTPRSEPVRHSAPTRPERLLCIFGERMLGGRWTPGDRVDVLAVFSEVTLDLRNAALADGCEIEVHAVFSSVRVLLPPDAVLDANVGPVMGNVQDHATPYGGMGPRVRLRGTAALAEVAIRRAPANLPPDAPFRLAWKEARRAAGRARC